ncbi:VOC family protein, partial [Streptomyces cyaneofuscatus]|uniref:VOC family protein n=1 Tax=Streptomyces cyaneofuscatus TaxID=66883 RepID=UPI003794C0F8
NHWWNVPFHLTGNGITTRPGGPLGDGTVFTVADVPRSRAFYADVLGGEVVLAENPCTVRLANSWIIMNPGGGPTPDKPGITLSPPADISSASCFLNIRVADIEAVHRDWSAKGAQFITGPVDRKAEIRC